MKQMNLNVVNVNIDIGGDIVSYSKDGIIIDELTGTFEILELLVYISDYYRAKEWFKNTFNTSTPQIKFNITETDEQGNTKVIGQLAPNKLSNLAMFIFNNMEDEQVQNKVKQLINS